MNTRYVLITLLLSMIVFQKVMSQPPRLTVVIVVDQFAHHEMRKYAPYFHGGLKFLADRGVVYDQANVPHGMPSTAVGHAGLSTGAYAHNHGIIGNHWYDRAGEKEFSCNDDTIENAAEFAPNGFYDDAYSNKPMLVDGISDQYLLEHTGQKRAVFSISIKPRAAIACSGYSGKPIWFDSNAGRMTSSKAFYYELPRWLDRFNENHTIAEEKEIAWRLAYAASNKAYRYAYAFDDRFTDFGIKTTRKMVSLHFKSPKGKASKYRKPHKWFEITPQANQYLLDCAYECAKKELPQHDNMLLWVSLSSFDKLGHRVGPQNIALIDMLYHLDKQLRTFMKAIDRLMKRKESVLYVLTADHGVMPMPELVAQRGYPARRIHAKKVIRKINEDIENQFGIKNLVKHYKAPQFFIDEPLFYAESKENQESIVQLMKKTVENIVGIKQAWTFDELWQATYPAHSVEDHLKQQLYPERSGFLTVLTHPYVLLSDYRLGTSHSTPYNYDTQVPLIWYQKSCYEKKHIPQQVWLTQVPVTLAHIFDIPRPSAAQFDILPGLFD